jgi:hypothetical protein
MQRLARIRLARSGALAALDAFVSARPEDSIRPDYCDLILLHRLVRKRRPRHVVEFGGGCSTVVLAHALALNGGGELVSVDASADWADSTRAAIPAELAARCRVLYREAVEAERFGVAGFQHVDVPALRADFVYVDGPPLTDERAVAFDVFDLDLAPRCAIVVDGRPSQARLIAKRLEPRRSKARVGYHNHVFELN